MFQLFVFSFEHCFHFSFHFHFSFYCLWMVNLFIVLIVYYCCCSCCCCCLLFWLLSRLRSVSMWTSSLRWRTEDPALKFVSENFFLSLRFSRHCLRRIWETVLHTCKLWKNTHFVRGTKNPHITPSISNGSGGGGGGGGKKDELLLYFFRTMWTKWFVELAKYFFSTWLNFNRKCNTRNWFRSVFVTKHWQKVIPESQLPRS